MADIAAATGVATGSVHNFLMRKTKIRLAPATTARLRGRTDPAVVAAVVAARKAGDPASTIAARLGLKPKQVYKICQDNGVVLAPEARRKNTYGVSRGRDYTAAVELRRQGLTVEEIAARTEIPFETLSCELPKHLRMLGTRTMGELRAAAQAHGLQVVSDRPDDHGVARGTAMLCRCGHTFVPSQPLDVLYGRIASCGCVRSAPQLEVEAFVRGLGFDTVRDATGVLPGRQEVDVWVPERRLGIEYCGLYWHGEARLGRSYHRDKLRAAEQAGVRLVTMFEHEWGPRAAGYLRAILGRHDTRVQARKCTWGRLEWAAATAFFEAHHIQGAPAPGTYVAGLTFGDTLVAALCCRHAPTRDAKGRAARWELTRYCVRAGTIVVGGFDRLWTHFLEDVRPPQVVSFSDNRWSAGDLYRRAGFVLSHEVPPSYHYFKGRRLYHKSGFKKADIARKLGPLLPGETEAAAMQRFGYGRIWDCGLRCWVWTPDVSPATLCPCPTRSRR